VGGTGAEAPAVKAGDILFGPLRSERERWRFWLKRGLLPDVTPEEGVHIWTRLLDGIDIAERAFGNAVEANKRLHAERDAAVKSRDEWKEAWERDHQ